MRGASRTSSRSEHRWLTELDPCGANRAAHTLKSSAGSLCAFAASDAARRLDEIGRDPELANAEVAYGKLEEEIARLEAVLRYFVTGTCRVLTRRPGTGRES